MTYGHLRADCLYTGISSGPNARYRVWESLYLFTARRYASAVLGVVILSVCPSVRLSHACFVTNPKEPTGDIFVPHERAIFLVKCDFSYSCAAADKTSTDLRARAVSLRQLSYLYFLDDRL